MVVEEIRIEKLISKIEFKVAMENAYWEQGKEKAAERKGDQIDGMLDALSTLTGIKYIIKDGKVVELN